MERLRAAEDMARERQAEEEFQQRTMTVLNSSHPNTDFRRKKMDWYQ